MAQNHIQSVLRPASLEEAWRMKTEAGDAARFLGGGVDLALFTPKQVTRLIDLDCLGLSEIRAEEGGLVIGAMTTLTEILESEAVAAYAGGVLRSMMRRVASPLQRSMATLGGTLARAHPWSDVIPVLLVLDAEISMYDGETRSVPLVEYLARRGESQGLILGVHLPALADGAKTAFVKHALTAFDVAMLNCATFAVAQDGVWKDVRIAIGGTPALAKRLEEVEALFSGQPMGDETLDTAARKASAAIDARDDIRASADYRRTLASSGVRACLKEMSDRAEGSAS